MLGRATGSKCQRSGSGFDFRVCHFFCAADHERGRNHRPLGLHELNALSAREAFCVERDVLHPRSVAIGDAPTAAPVPYDLGSSHDAATIFHLKWKAETTLSYCAYTWNPGSGFTSGCERVARGKTAIDLFAT